MAEAAKTATVIDDFQIDQLNEALWAWSGASKPSVSPVRFNDTPAGCLIPAGRSITTITGTGLRYDFNDSEVSWVVNRWNVGGVSNFYVTQGAGATQYLFGFQYDGATKTMTIRSARAGVFTTASFTNWRYMYMKVAHSSVTGKVEFYAGFAKDGSDQRRITPANWGTHNLITNTNQCDDMTIVVNRDAAADSVSLVLGSVNSPNQTIDRTYGNPGAYLVRDFDTWSSRLTGQFLATEDCTSHEWYVVRTLNSTAIKIDFPTAAEKTLTLMGGDFNRTTIRSALHNKIKNVNFECDLVPVSFGSDGNPNNEFGYIGLMWRVNDEGNMRYQLNIYSDRIEVVAIANNTISATIAQVTRTLATQTLASYTGTAYKWRINHFEDRITIYRDDIEILNVTDLVNYIDTEGHIGFDLDHTSLPYNVFASIRRVYVSPAYDDMGITSGVALGNRSLGIHAKLGRRDETQTTMKDDPSIVRQMETTYRTKFKTVYHFSEYADAVDQPMIDAAIRHAREGRTNVIAWNSFGSDRLSTIPSGALDAEIDAWAAALKSIPGQVYVLPLPFPNLNQPWSPTDYDQLLGQVNLGLSTTALVSGASWTTNEFAGRTVTFVRPTGVVDWRTVVSNTADTLTFTPAMTGSYSSSNVQIQRTTSGGTAEEYVAAFQYIRNRLNSQGCPARVGFSANWAPDAVNNTSGIYFSNWFDVLYPGDDSVDAFLIRAIEPGDGRSLATTGVWRSTSQMLQGISAQSPSAYQEFSSVTAGRPIFLMSGVAETHARWNDFEYGNPLSPLTSDNSQSDSSDSFTTFSSGSTPGYILYASFGAEIDISDGANFAGDISLAISTFGAGDTKYVEWDMPTTDVKYASFSVYMNASSGALGVANERSDIIKFLDASNNTVAALRLDGATKKVSLLDSAGSTVAIMSPTLVDLEWYRFEIDVYCEAGKAGTHYIRSRLYNVSESDIRGGERGFANTTATLTLNQPTKVRMGLQLADLANNVTGTTNEALYFESPKLSWDLPTEKLDKGKWIEDLLGTRGFPEITTTILMSGDVVRDVVPTSIGTLWGQNNVDTRLDSSRYTSAKVTELFTGPISGRIHTRPQVRQSGYTDTARIGNLEYATLVETGYAPLVLAPRVGGILLRDFDLGAPVVRPGQEVRSADDGVRDYTRYLGAKSVSLSFVCFDDPSGSAAFYSDVLSAWAHPRRRPKLIYKMKDGNEREVQLRPEIVSRPWTVDGVRAGTIEIQLQFVGVDGKEFSTTENKVLLLPDRLTSVNTIGTASVSPTIRLHGGWDGCLNPSLVLTSEERRTFRGNSRISLGSAEMPLFVPGHRYVEIDMLNRTVQLDGCPDPAASYLRYLDERQWFRLDPYYNALTFTQEDGTGFAEIYWRDAYL